MSTVHIDYTDRATTNIKIDDGEPAIEFTAAQGPAFIVLAGESDTLKEVSVFAGGDYVRNTSLSFYNPIVASAAFLASSACLSRTLRQASGIWLTLVSLSPSSLTETPSATVM